MKSVTCKQCEKKTDSNLDGYCPECLAKEQRAVLGDWSGINETKEADN